MFVDDRHDDRPPSCPRRLPDRAQVRDDSAVTPYMDYSTTRQCVHSSRRDRPNEPGRTWIVHDA